MGKTEINEETLKEAYQAAMNALFYLMEADKFIVSEDDNGELWMCQKKDNRIGLSKIANVEGGILDAGTYDSMDKLKYKETPTE